MKQPPTAPGRSEVAPLAPGARHWTARRAVRRTLEVLRERGLKGAWFGVVGELGYRRLELLAAKPSEEGAPVARLGEEDLGAYAALRGPAAAGVASRRFAAGDVCVGVWEGDELLGVNWLAGGEPWAEYLGTRVPLWPDEIYAFDLFVAPRVRGRGIGSALVRAVVAEAGPGRRVVVGVMPENAGALRLFRRGFEPAGRLRVVRLGPFRRAWIRRPARAGGGAPVER